MAASNLQLERLWVSSYSSGLEDHGCLHQPGAALSEYCHCKSQTPFRKMSSRYSRIDFTVVFNFMRRESPSSVPCYASDLTSSGMPGDEAVGRCIESRPALPSKTNGPALLVGVIGPISEPGVIASLVVASLLKKSPSARSDCEGVMGRRKTCCDRGVVNAWPSTVEGNGMWRGGVMP